MDECTLTDRGQVSLPASLRKAMRLHAGQRLRFAQVSASEFRVTVIMDKPAGPVAMLGFARKLRPGAKRRTTADWMRELRAGEEA